MAWYVGIEGSNYISHHGIHGQKWGIRRFQNPDGTLTEAGKRRYGSSSTSDISTAKGYTKRLNDIDQSIAMNTASKSAYSEAANSYRNRSTGYKQKIANTTDEGRLAKLNEKLTKSNAKAEEAETKAAEFQKTHRRGKR